MNFSDAMSYAHDEYHIHRFKDRNRYFFYDKLAKSIMSYELCDGSVTRPFCNACFSLHDYIADDWEIVPKRKKLFITIKTEDFELCYTININNALIIGDVKKIIAVDDGDAILWEYINE